MLNNKFPGIVSWSELGQDRGSTHEVYAIEHDIDFAIKWA